MAVSLRGDAPVVAGSMVRGGDHEVPFHVMSLPAESIVTQNEVLGHEMPVNWPRGSPVSGLDHEVPFHCDSPPPAAMQNDGEAQAMAEALPQALIAADHDDPSNVKPSPMPSMAAQKEPGAHPTAWRGRAPGSGAGDDHEVPFHVATRLADGTAMHRVAPPQASSGPG